MIVDDATAARLVGVDGTAHSLAVLEISRVSRAPGHRLLYGVDTRHNRGLVVLGEWRNRRFYGDSVRRAEEVWRQFLDGQLQATHPARSRLVEIGETHWVGRTVNR